MVKLAQRARLGARAATGLLLACSLGVVTPSLAQEVEPPSSTEDDRARELFVRGASLAKANRWLEALAAFDESGQLLPHAKTSFNVGYCARALGRFTRARAAFRAALMQHEQGASLTDAQVEAAREYLREAEERVVRAAITLSPEGTTMKVDGANLMRDAEGWWSAWPYGPSAVTPPEAPGERFALLLDPGRHVLTATSPQGKVRTLDVSPEGGERPSYRIDVPSSDEATASAEAARGKLGDSKSPATPTTTSNATQVRTVFGIVLGASGLTSGVLATAFTVHAAATADEPPEACPRRTVCPDDRAAMLASEADTFADGATIAWTIAASAAAGAVLVLVLRDDVTVSTGAGAFVVRHAF